MPRSLPLDALRGIAIILMVLSSRIPFGVLPEWMYHAQVPPPAHKFDGSIPGITWVDLVFPYFLFAMGAAIPLALHARLTRGDALWSISLSILKRGAILTFFAIYVMHIRPTVMADKPGWPEWTLALTGFLLLFPMLATLPRHWTAKQIYAVRTVGWLGAIVVLCLFTAKPGAAPASIFSGDLAKLVGQLFTGDFSPRRSDIIILVLANVAVTGSFIWLFTRERLDIRIGILAFLFALRLTQSLPGIGQWLWNLSPLPWLGTVYFQQYLFIIIPGTIAGDLLLKYINAPTQPANRRFWLIAAIAPVLTLWLLTLLKGRYVVEATLGSALMVAGGLYLLRNADATQEKLLRSLLAWGALWLLLGLAFEPYEGGIKKDRATMSYYFVTSGLAFITLVALIVAIEMARRRVGFRLMIVTGQNPLVAYAGVQSLLPPILGMTGAGNVIAGWTKTPWLGALRGAFYTWVITEVGAWFAKRGILLKT
jgi:predicted acyltransferase